MLVVRSKSGPDACFALPSRPGHEDSRCHRRVPSWFQLRKTMMVPLCSDYQLMFWISANNDVDLQKHCCSFTHTLESPRVRSRFFEGKQRTTLGKTVVELPVLRLSTTVNCLSGLCTMTFRNIVHQFVEFTRKQRSVVHKYLYR